MIWCDDSFDYSKTKEDGFKFKPYCSEEYTEDLNGDDLTCNVDYNSGLGMYRVTFFRNNHWSGDVVFDEITNAYCPICDAMRYIPKLKGYCNVCGHHLNITED